METHSLTNLCVKVLRPTNAADDRGPKAKWHAKADVQFLWLVDPIQRTFEVGIPKARTFTGVLTDPEAMSSARHPSRISPSPWAPFGDPGHPASDLTVDPNASTDA